MSGRTVEIEVVLLHVLPVITLAIGQPEQALFQNRVLAIPQRQGKAESLLVVGDPSQPVFAPTIRPGTGMVVGEIVPGVSIFAVIFTHRPPLTFTQIRPPCFPGLFAGAGCLEPLLFFVTEHVLPSSVLGI